MGFTNGRRKKILALLKKTNWTRKEHKKVKAQSRMKKIKKCKNKS